MYETSSAIWIHLFMNYSIFRGFIDKHSLTNIVVFVFVYFLKSFRENTQNRKLYFSVPSISIRCVIVHMPFWSDYLDFPFNSPLLEFRYNQLTM